RLVNLMFDKLDQLEASPVTRTNASALRMILEALLTERAELITIRLEQRAFMTIKSDRRSDSPSFGIQRRWYSLITLGRRSRFPLLWNSAKVVFSHHFGTKVRFPVYLGRKVRFDNHFGVSLRFPLLTKE